MTAEIRPAVKMPGAIGALNGVAGRVGGIAVHGVVVADRLHERRDVALLDDPR